MKRLVIHWTAGQNKPNATDLEHYHFIIDGQGKVFEGKFKPEDNINCQDGKYAQHTGGGNTDSIGVSMCGMMGFLSTRKVGSYPLTKIQCETCFQLCAKLAKKYNIPLDKQHIYTHYTFNKEHKIMTGKIDIIYLPAYPQIQKDDIIRFIIDKIKWYYDRL